MSYKSEYLDMCCDCEIMDFDSKDIKCYDGAIQS